VGSVDRRRPLAAALCVIAAAGLAGCKTTQQTSDRLGVRAKRVVESRTPIEVKQPNPDVRVVRTTLLHGKKSAAVVVTLKNTGDKNLNDLPLEITEGENALNSNPKVPYFQAHAPVLAAGEEATWVFTTKHDPGAGSVSAKVGRRETPPLTTAETIPDLDLSYKLHEAKKGPATVQVEVANGPDVPQYDLEVYAWAEKGGQVVAAGRGVLEHLGTGSSAELTLTLIGDPAGSKLQVHAPPTLFE
jgi:hypothetical protein